MSVYNAFFRANQATPINGTPWPDVPVPVEGAYIVGHIGQSPNWIWHCCTQNADDHATLAALPQYMGSSYAELLTHGNGPDVFVCIVFEDGIYTRVKMRDKPVSGVVEENVPPHVFAGVSA